MPLRELFPPIEPYAKGMLKVDDLHTLYWEECGNPDGLPVVFLHGGPGAGSLPVHRRFFDPAVWRIVIFDQRGAGRSTPLGEMQRNTTDLLITDIETLRHTRRIDRWFVLGGSWGSTLALAYAEKHPERCFGLVLRGICLLRQSEIDWFLYGLRNVFPEVWSRFAGFIAPTLRHDLLGAYLNIFSGPDDALKREAVRLWLQYETTCSTLLPAPETMQQTIENDQRSAMPILEAHYFKNNLFTPEDKLLKDVGRIRRIPAVIIQGRYDMVCPIVTADELHRHWPEAEYRVIPNAGHSALEPGIRSALIEAMEKFKGIAG
jgi:proline iminopeptidase